MQPTITTRDRVSNLVRYHADPDLSREQVSARISAFVYGNVLLFATLIALTADDAEHWHGLAAVAGIAGSTYLAHVFAELVGHGAGSPGRGDRRVAAGVLRDAMPILSSAIVPALLMGAGALHWIAGGTATVLSEIYLLLRMALLGLLVERLRSTRPSVRTLFAGFGLAAVATLISVFKVLVGH